MNIIVTGGAGFIGRHLVSSLLQDENSVTIYDDLSKSSEEKISALVTKGAKFVKADITDATKLSEVLSKNGGYDYLVHLAAKTGVPDSVKNPQVTHHNNVTGSFTVFNECRKHGVENIVVASSAAVYGDPKKLPFIEKSEMNPLSPYGASKLIMENYLQAFSNCYDMNGISLRFANIYGQGQSLDYAGVITKFIDNTKNNKTLTIYGDGTNTRDFISVNDIVSGIKLALKNIYGKKGNAYNLATGTPTLIEDLANLILNISGKSLDIVNAEPRKGDIKHSYASIKLAQEELGYQPQVKLKDGLKNLLEFWNP